MAMRTSASARVRCGWNAPSSGLSRKLLQRRCLLGCRWPVIHRQTQPCGLKKHWLRPCISPTASSIGKVEPSLRCPTTTRPTPMIRRSRVRTYGHANRHQAASCMRHRPYPGASWSRGTAQIGSHALSLCAIRRDSARLGKNNCSFTATRHPASRSTERFSESPLSVATKGFD